MPTPPSLQDVRDELLPLSAEDLIQVEKNLQKYKHAPIYIWGGGLGMIALIIGGFSLLGKLDLFFWIFIGVVVLMLVFAHLGLRYHLSTVKKDIVAGKKRVVEGVLELAQMRYSSRKKQAGNPKPRYIWGVGGREFRVGESNFDRAIVGDRVQVHMLPDAGLIIVVKTWQFQGGEQGYFK